MKTRLRIIIMAMVMVLGLMILSSSAFAMVSDDDDYIRVYSPEENDVYFSGEKIKVDFKVYDVWESYYTVPIVGVGTSKTTIDSDFGEVADADQWNSYEWKHSLKGYAPGKYWMIFVGAPGYSNGDPLDDWIDYDSPKVLIHFTIKKLAAPKSVKAAAGSKKVTVKFKKATGAKKYEIYRSTSKNSGYKKIGTTSSAQYTDKKVKKGKAYYYKVKSVRSVRGTVKSAFSSAAKSGKVK